MHVCACSSAWSLLAIASQLWAKQWAIHIMHATRTKICRPRSAATERVAPDRPRRTGRATHLLPWLWLILLWIRPVNVSALPADSANPTNPIVRFSVIRGTNLLGAMDVELFEQEKPATVRNFLLYLQSGAYTNSFFHRCVPGFAVQGGGFTVTNAAATNGFLDYLAVTNFGRLTNEFLVGPRFSNTFGTLAMAKLGGDPDSATSQWFFNLGNNTTNLDNQNGGFTVFGRVLESTNSFDGTNVLQHFSSLSTNTE